MMKRRFGRGGLALAAVLTLGTLPTAAAPRTTRSLYDTKCSLCHGNDGRGNPALSASKVRDFTDPKWQQARTDAQIRAAIETGKANTLMRGFKSELSKDEIAALIQLIRAFAPPPKDAPAK